MYNHMCTSIVQVYMLYECRTVYNMSSTVHSTQLAHGPVLQHTQYRTYSIYCMYMCTSDIIMQQVVVVVK